MWVYVVKRLLVMGVTLFGIVVLSFVVVTMAPGDPAALGAAGLAQGRGAISEQTVEKNKELFFLDRPPLLNDDPPDRASSVAEAVGELRADDEPARQDAKAQLSGTIGTAALEGVLAALPGAVAEARDEVDWLREALGRLEGAAPDALPQRLEDLAARYPDLVPRVTAGERIPTPAERAAAWLRQEDALVELAERPPRLLLEVLGGIVPPARGGPDVAPAAADLAAAAATWEAWWSAHREEFSREAAEAAAARWLAEGEIPAAEGEEGEALEALVAVGQMAAPALMAALEDADEGSAREQRAAYGLSAVCHKPWDLTTSAAERTGYEKAWAEERAAIEATAAEVLGPGLEVLEEEVEGWRPEWAGLGPAALRAALLARADALDDADADAAARVRRLVAEHVRPPDAYVDRALGRLDLMDRADARELIADAGVEELAADPEARAAQLDAVAEALGADLPAAAAKAEDLDALAWAAIGGQYVRQRELEEFDQHRYRWGSWWYRAEEYYTDFTGAEQAGRAFTQTQFGRWLSRLLSFDFGESYKQKRPVSTILLERLPPTLILNLTSFAIAYLLAVPLGIFSATHKGTFADRASTVLLFLLYSIPSFWAGAMLILLLTGEPFWDLFPAYHFSSLEADKLSTWGRVKDVAWHLVLPVVALTYGLLAYISRQMRSSMLEAIRQDYVRTARAKGLPERKVIYKHALRNALIPIITLLGSVLPFMFAGSVIIETIFTIEGLGKLFFQAVLDRDYPVIMANLVITAFLTLLGYLVADLGYAVVDPRIQYR